MLPTSKEKKNKKTFAFKGTRPNEIQRQWTFNKIVHPAIVPISLDHCLG